MFSLSMRSLGFRLRMLGAPSIPLLGLMRVGTNVTRAVLESHYRVRIDYNRFGWKHGVLPTIAPGCSWAYPKLAPLVIVKHPLAVAHSLQNYTTKIGRNISSNGSAEYSSFIRNRIVVFCQELALHPEYRYSNPLQMWNHIVWNHVNFAKRANGLVIRYEDLLSDTEAVCERIADHYKLVPRPESGRPRLPEKAARRMKDEANQKRQQYVTDEAFAKVEFFQKGEFLECFTESDFDFAESELDAELMNMLGYDVRELLKSTPSEDGICPVIEMDRKRA